VFCRLTRAGLRETATSFIGMFNRALLNILTALTHSRSILLIDLQSINLLTFLIKKTNKQNKIKRLGCAVKANLGILVDIVGNLSIKDNNSQLTTK
jgi:hypothetical protein